MFYQGLEGSLFVIEKCLGGVGGCLGGVWEVSGGYISYRKDVYKLYLLYYIIILFASPYLLFKGL